MKRNTIIALIICAIATARGYATDTPHCSEPEPLALDYSAELIPDGCDLTFALPNTSEAATSATLGYSNDNYDDDEIEIIPAKQNKKSKKKKKKSFNSPKTKSVWGISAGYTSKHWRKRTATGKEEILYLLDNRNLHGVQLGVRFNPLFKYGFGLDIGLFYEYYHYRYTTPGTAPGEEDLRIYRTLNEHVARIPIHLEYRLNFSRSFQLFIFGGIAADYILAGNMIISDQNTPNSDANEVITNIYGSVIPSESRFNVALSFGAGLRFGAIQFNVSNTHGIYNCTPYKDYVILQDNPLNITMSVMF